MDSSGLLSLPRKLECVDMGAMTASVISINRQQSSLPRGRGLKLCHFVGFHRQLPQKGTPRSCACMVEISFTAVAQMTASTG
jgi:hypothetical protein